MICHTGPTKPALVLLCCVGTWLAICSLSFGAPTATMIKTILELLKLESKELYEDYSKKDADGLPTNESLQLPCFTLGYEASTSISTIQVYLETAKRLSDNRADTTNVTKRLDDIRCSNPPKPSISEPEDFHERKIFTLTVLKRFSDCMAKLEAKDRIC
ncbi:interleukin-31 [Cricetulus griseus]|uniref:Interleukin-31 n=2 Tax=Cricetulus griseus TaxID=10029 RepID=A0A3L7HQA0_CRIGR|nr:interleukin-31 [Cricetulus griseus]XP_035302829.1 interleukin-31 [Cricetulus griseus]